MIWARGTVRICNKGSYQLVDDNKWHSILELDNGEVYLDGQLWEPPIASPISEVKGAPDFTPPKTLEE